jgi:hypothetical protein
MKLSTKIALWVYLVGVLLTEVICLRFGYVLGAFGRMHGLVDFAAYQAVNFLIAATWPLWAIMITLQLLGFEF